MNVTDKTAAFNSNLGIVIDLTGATRALAITRLQGIFPSVSVLRIALEEARTTSIDQRNYAVHSWKPSRNCLGAISPRGSKTLQTFTTANT